MIPDVMNRYSDREKIQCRQDIIDHLNHLDAAVWAESEGVYGEYGAWVRSLFKGIGLTDQYLLTILNAIKQR